MIPLFSSISVIQAGTKKCLKTVSFNLRDLKQGGLEIPEILIIEVGKELKNGFFHLIKGLKDHRAHVIIDCTTEPYGHLFQISFLRLGIEESLSKK